MSTLDYADKVILYEKLVATNPTIERKGDTMPYTSVNGNMYSVVYKDGTVTLRLPEEARTVFMKKYKTTHPEQYGAVLKEYVVVPDALLKKTTELKHYFDLSYEYACSLKPKPARKKKGPTEE